VYYNEDVPPHGEWATRNQAGPVAKPKIASRPQSVRFEPVLEQRVHAAAAHEGLSVSAFIRAAVQERTDRVLGDSGLWDRIGPIVEGIPATGEPSDAASNTHQVFGEAVEERRAQTSRLWSPTPEG
jgi:hypothetical protein